MKFLADMPVSPRTVDFLRRKGHDVIHLRERGLQKASDEEVFSLAISENRVILTMDLDFSQIAALGKMATPSILLFRLENGSPENINQLIDRYLSEIQTPVEKGSIIIFEEHRIRIHALPI